MALQHFHLFPALPRELQLRIWEAYEADVPHFRHYFLKMATHRGRLYGVVDQNADRKASNDDATPQDPTQTEVVDPALTPRNKIQLLGENHWKSRFPNPLTPDIFSLRSPRPPPSQSYIWVNFKYDTFYFVNAIGLGPDLLDYLKGKDGITAPTRTAPVDMAQWFFHIQNLDILLLYGENQLGPFDRQVLSGHPSLRTITLVLLIDEFICPNQFHTPELSLRFSPHSDSVARRIPLDKCVSLMRAVRSYGCSYTGRFDSAKELQQDITDLFSEGQGESTGCRHVPEIRIEVELHLPPGTKIDDLITAKKEAEEEEERLREHLGEDVDDQLWARCGEVDDLLRQA